MEGRKEEKGRYKMKQNTTNLIRSKTELKFEKNRIDSSLSPEAKTQHMFLC